MKSLGVPICVSLEPVRFPAKVSIELSPADDRGTRVSSVGAPGGVYCRPVDIARQSSGLDAGSSGVAAAVSRGKGAGRPLIVRNPTPSPDRHDIRRRASVDPHGGI